MAQVGLRVRVVNRRGEKQPAQASVLPFSALGNILFRPSFIFILILIPALNPRPKPEILSLQQILRIHIDRSVSGILD